MIPHDTTVVNRAGKDKDDNGASRVVAELELDAPGERLGVTGVRLGFDERPPRVAEQHAVPRPRIPPDRQSDLAPHRQG